MQRAEKLESVPVTATHRAVPHLPLMREGWQWRIPFCEVVGRDSGNCGRAAGTRGGNPGPELPGV